MRWARRTSAAVAAVLLGMPCRPAGAEDLSNGAFRIQFDASGIVSLRRTDDVHDTDYIAANAALGRLLIRYRTTRNGDWRELRELLMRTPPPHGQSIEYTLASTQPTLAARSSASAAVGAGGLRALNDGVVPNGGAASAAQVPLFTWSGSRGSVQWVQYTFPSEQVVSRAEVFWVTPPRSWRLLYQDGGEWKEVPRPPAYATETNRFIGVDFASVNTLAMRVEATMAADASVTLAEWRVGPPPALAPPADLAVEERFALGADALDWTIVLRNDSARTIEIGDLAVPLPFAERTGARGDIYTKKLLRHALLAGHGSWVYWQRAGGDGPFLVMTPEGRTKFEYSDSAGGVYTPYVHAKVAAARAVAAGGAWRLPITGATLAPKGSAESTITYGFRFKWARDVAGVRDVLFDEQKFDTAVVPGMVVPVDLAAMFSLRTKNAIDRIEPDHPAETHVSDVPGAAADVKAYKVSFSRLGENTLTIRYGRGLWTNLQFFVTEPLETVIHKRAAFLVSHQQHADPDTWYYGAYGDWDQKNEILRNPDDRDGLSTWLTDADDDAGNARPAFLASKNVFFPNQTEIDSLERYIGRYLWGGMQRTERETYPYGIYGIPNWKANRASADPGRNGQAHLWRIYDYPHIVMLYYRMYQIAKFYPSRVRYLDAAGYLERAYRTAVAYWTVPNEIERWSANAVGTMNEAFIPDLIESLEDEGHRPWADVLRGYWDAKVDRFVNHTPNLYGSEFAFDSTGFESTGAFAKYAVSDARSAAFRTTVPLDTARKFLNFQLLLNVSDRGWLETSYFQLGSDYRGNLSYLLSYMSQLGGWSILDYALYVAKDPTDTLRLGFASALSSWALVNSGDEKSGYGYWFPGRNNDGATGGGFMPDAIGRAWIGKEMARGAWYYSAEEDVGYCGALRTHATVVARDPTFGELAYGGVLTRDGRDVKVVPRDGLRVRFHVVRDGQRLHMILDRDGYAKEQPIVVDDDLSRVRFTLENRGGDAHETRLTIGGLPAGDYAVSVEGRTVATITGGSSETHVRLPIASRATSRVVIARR